MSGVQSFVREVIVGAAVKPVRSRPHRVVQETTTHLPVFRCEVTGEDGNLLNGIHTWLCLLRCSGSQPITRVLALRFESLQCFPVRH